MERSIKFYGEMSFEVRATKIEFIDYLKHNAHIVNKFVCSL